MEPSSSFERRPPYPRTASRSSTSTTNTRMTSQSANSSSSHIAPSPQVPSHHTHRYHHASCALPSSPRATPRATPRLSREASAESNRQPSVSSFLLEKLQKERRAESEKASLSRSNTDISLSTDRAAQPSPAKTSESDGRRPQSATGEKRKGLGVKDMEQVISSLHKQNFDLKLELYHRRERQTALEERVEALEADKAHFDEMNEKLVLEMEKRDKAVEEAVAMIIMLEAKLEQFAQERSMVQRIEAESHYAHLDPFQHPTPKARTPDILRLEDDVRSIPRMPSFLSERSENTENLRNVYLGVKGSVISLPQVVEGSGDADSHANGLVSPTLSILSESSFVSVYGQKDPDVDEPLSLDGADGLAGHASAIKRPKTALAKPVPMNRASRSNSLTTTGPRQFQQIANIIDGSPLQRIERLDRTYSKKEEPRPQSRDQDPTASISSRGNKSPNHRRMREEKREALRKVLTDAPGGVRLHDHALPPTPDTISTSTLRRFQNSNDTLSKQDVSKQRAISGISDISAHEEAIEQPPTGASLQPEPVEAKARDFSGGNYFDNRPMIQRPRSAGETTVSHRRGNDWDSDSDDSDTRSLESSLDIWMRESAKPDRTGGRASPDLFGFPAASKGGWNTDAMFGPSNNYGASTVDPERLLEMFPVQPAVYNANAPPPPNRRSSLHAQTGSNSACSTMKSSRSGGVRKSPNRRKYSRSRRNSDDPQMRANLKTPVQSSSQPPPPPNTDQKKNHYPPITGQQTVRNGLTKLFRRSLGGSSNPAETPADPVAIAAEIPRSHTAMGVPSWVCRAPVEDDRESATPPPIMRNPRQARGPIEIDLPVPATPGMDPVVPTTPMTAIPPESFTPEQQMSSPRVPSASANRRKWLPAFGRNSVKNKTG